MKRLTLLIALSTMVGCASMDGLLLPYEYKNKYGYSRDDRAKYIAEQPAEMQQLIADKQIQLGMTRLQALLSWGMPRDVNPSVGSWGRHEQWVYRSTYLYFKNDKLTSWQG